MSRELTHSFRIPGSPPGAARLRALILRFLEALPPNRSYWVDVREHKPLRSLQQNRYLWGVVYPAILRNGGEQLRGWTSPDLHEYLLGECYGWEECGIFGRIHLRPNRRSSALTKQEFTDYIEFIKSHMAQHGVHVPEAGEYE